MTEQKQSFDNYMDDRTQDIPPGSVYQAPNFTLLNFLLMLWSPWSLLREYVLYVDSHGSCITNNVVSQRTNHKIWVERPRPKGDWYTSMILLATSNTLVFLLSALQHILCGPAALLVYLTLPQDVRDKVFYPYRELRWIRTQRSHVSVPTY